MTCHVNEHLATSLDVLCFHDEAFLRLYGRASFRINHWFPIGALSIRSISLHFLEHLLHFRTHLAGLNFLIELHQLSIAVLL